ncbi:MAG: metalloregulator ArsR/SmtB family transcription factor [Actinomycetota bacterium]|nr:metalloregulator ArsR/SmtB family transcription factor [Actinomycetota bacterium]
MGATAGGLLNGTFLALVADPHRWQLLAALAESDRRVGELTDLTGAPQSLVSYHLAQLRGAGLISARRSSADGRDTYYRAELARCAELFEQASASLYPGLRLVPAPPPVWRTQERKPRVLFLCTGNSARSQMAEGLLDVRSGGGVEARSAGSHPKALHPEAVRVMAERGVDIGERKTKHLSRFARSRFDRVITLCDKVKEVCPDFPGHPASAHWSMADPAAGGEDDTTYHAFVRTAEEIDGRIHALLAQLADAYTEKEHA